MPQKSIPAQPVGSAVGETISHPNVAGYSGAPLHLSKPAKTVGDRLFNIAQKSHALEAILTMTCGGQRDSFASMADHLQEVYLFHASELAAEITALACTPSDAGDGA